MIKELFKPIFRKISTRVCTASFKVDNDKHFLFISGYAPHESLSNESPELRDNFYDDLQKALKLKKSNSFVILGLDANAKTNYDPETHPNVLGPFTKGHQTNNNGQRLLHFAAENDLFLTNTKFQHKMSHRTTWTAPYRRIRTKNGELRRNPIRNQIDYILINNRYLQFTTNSRSYNNLETDTDHNLVLMNLRTQLSKLNKPNKEVTPIVNKDLFRNQRYADKYKIKVTEKHDAQEDKEFANNEEKWTNIVETCLEAGIEVLGVKDKRSNQSENKEIKELSERKQRLKNKMQGCNSQETRSKLRDEMKSTKKKINKKLKKIEEDDIDKKLELLEQIKDDNTKYFYVLRDLQKLNNNKKASIIVKDKEGNCPGSTQEKITVIEEYFKETLAPDDMKEEFLNVPPQEMSQKFTANEIQKLAKKLNNDKACGPDQLHAEYIKHAPPIIHEKIAEIYNDTAATGDTPTSLIHGLLLPLPKPGKQKGPPANLRPIILLSILRKILTIALLQRIWDRLARKIPKSQAAYQQGRGTTEQVLALKILIDKAITSTDYDLYILLIDMSKAFDTVNRKLLLQQLEKVLQPDELHLLSILTNRPLITVTLDGEKGEGFRTFVGICQGDCLSAVLFIFYLACALEKDPDDQVTHDLKAFLDILYADDLTYSTTSQNHREVIKTEIPPKLKLYNLHVNTTKTEEGEAPDKRPPPPPPPPPLENPEDKIIWSELDWLLPPVMKPPEPTYKNIKLLGTKLDTKCDISAKKSKVWDPIKKFRQYFTSKRLSIQHKIRLFRTFVEPILLYNSETWTLTATLEKSIDSFHRRLLRIAINYKYPKIITNEKLYTLTKEIPLSEKIKRRRLALFGHILRLDPETPAQRALHLYICPHKRPVGRPPLTWIALITKDLSNTLNQHKIKTPLNNDSIEKLKNLASVRTQWREEISRSMRRNSL